MQHIVLIDGNTVFDQLDAIGKTIFSVGIAHNFDIIGDQRNQLNRLTCAISINVGKAITAQLPRPFDVFPKYRRRANRRRLYIQQPPQIMRIYPFARATVALKKHQWQARFRAGNQANTGIGRRNSHCRHRRDGIFGAEYLAHRLRRIQRNSYHIASRTRRSGHRGFILNQTTRRMRRSGIR